MRKSRKVFMALISAISIIFVVVLIVANRNKENYITAQIDERGVVDRSRTDSLLQDDAASETREDVDSLSEKAENINDEKPRMLNLLWQKSYSTNNDLIMRLSDIGNNTFPVNSIVVNMINKSDSVATFGEEFIIEKLEKGEWKPLPLGSKILRQMKEEGIAYVDLCVLMLVEPHSSRKHKQSTIYYSETIVPGIYRINKEFFIDIPNAKVDTVCVEFEIR